MRNYSQFFSILKKNDLNHRDVVREFTKGRTDSLRALTDKEFEELMIKLAPYNRIPPGDGQRKKMIALGKLMKWGKNTAEVKQELNTWLLKQKYQKPLMQLDLQQLGVMVTVLEDKVYSDYLRGLNK